MSMVLSCSMVFLVLLGLAQPSIGKSFMPRQEEVEASLLKQLSSTFRPSAKTDHIFSLEAALRPMYVAVPQGADGRLSHAVVCYVLHRFFAKRGWSIRGLEPESGTHNKSSDSKGLQEWVPSYLTGLLEKMSGGHGISLRELAILAATLEDLVLKETISHLELAFHALELPRDVDLPDEQVSEILDIFMMIYKLGGELNWKSTADLWRGHAVFAEFEPDWGGMKEWMQAIWKALYPHASSLDFNDITRIAEEIGARYGSYRSGECMHIKDALLEAESQKAGRVRLPDFYRQEFDDTIEYLRASGALDESDPEQPHVIIPNYLSTPRNCFKVSSFYTVCCMNQCQNLMDKLENSIASEMALPEQIVQLVSGLSSDTVIAPRVLSPALTSRLYSVAEGNAGQVPLHGRLFAQWMHHAFPLECSFPHQEGSANPQAANEWLEASTFDTARASIEDMEAYIDGDTAQVPKGADAKKHHNSADNDLQWLEHEEPLFPFGHSVRSQPPRNALQAGIAFIMLPSMASGIMLVSKKLLAGTAEQRQDKLARYIV